VHRDQHVETARQAYADACPDADTAVGEPASEVVGAPVEVRGDEVDAIVLGDDAVGSGA
jgi:hypothetical protein